MFKRELEFRGINIQHLGMYFEELGAMKVTNTFPLVFNGESWSGKIVGEEEISFTKTFKVNAVHIEFCADNEEVLNELIKNYRYKTTRIGG